MWIVGFVLTASLLIVGFNRAAITEMPDKYVRLEQYRCDINEIKAALIRIEQRQMDE